MDGNACAPTNKLPVGLTGWEDPDAGASTAVVPDEGSESDRGKKETIPEDTDGQ